jgi:uncharacterized protein (DUF1800 family)
VPGGILDNDDQALSATADAETPAGAVTVSDAGSIALAVSAAAALTACGGGGGGSAPAPAPAPPPSGPPPPPPISDVEAARFLQQAQFSSTRSEIDALKTAGYSAWLTTNYSSALGQKGVEWLDAQGHNSITSEQRYFWPQFGDFMIWNQLFTGPDQMRKRMALALSEYFVVSLNPIDGFYPPYLIAAYWDELTANAFGNFRTLLERITLNPAMGMYLNTKGNLKADAATGRQPDENYAREVMQLFTIGLHELNLDGTEKLSGGNPIETYGQSDITNLARVFTGYDWDYSTSTFTTVAWHNYQVPSTHWASRPMRFRSQDHSPEAVTFLGTTIPAGTSGAESLRIALDTLFNHPNTAPFFARQMIQRLVTSNPSPAYVLRVAEKFVNNGSGARGDLRAVWTAILTDTEARSAPQASETLRGKLREPVVRFVQWGRTVGIRSASGKWEMYDLSASDSLLGQSPLRSPSVFNFFRPGYVPPNTAIATAGRQAPEFQIHNETTTAGYINFLEWMVIAGYGAGLNDGSGNNDIHGLYTELVPLAHDSPALVTWINLHLTGNQLSQATRDRMSAALATYGVVQGTEERFKRAVCAAACLLALSCPEYLIQK